MDLLDQLKRMLSTIVSPEQMKSVRVHLCGGSAAEIACGLWLRGDLKTAFAMHREMGLQLSRSGAPWARGLWYGQQVDGKHLVIQPFDGHGTGLLACRVFPRLAARAATLTIFCSPAIGPLYSALPGNLRVVEAACPPGDLKRNAELALSLATKYGPVDLHSSIDDVIPNACEDARDAEVPVPYLRVPDDRVRSWSSIRTPGVLNVGLAWFSNRTQVQGIPFTANHHLRFRNATIAEIRPILDTPGVAFHSLQIGGAAELQANGLVGVIDHTPRIRDLADTAAIVDQLDLIITTDTCIPHLAGALGKPVWMLANHRPAMPWIAGRTDSPWYPSMRIFWQQQPRDWSDPVQQVRAALVAEVERRPHAHA